MDTEIAQLVLRSDAGGAAILTLNRPDKRNALSIDLFKALDAHLAVIEGETETVGAVVLRGAGPVFSAGADLTDRGRARPHFQAKVIERLANLPQPVVAGVHGLCFTGGVELILGCDLIVAAEGASFADTHPKWALTPGWGMASRLARRIGPYKAREMMFTGRVYSGREAEAIGLVNLCFPDAGFEAGLQGVIDGMLAQSWFSLRGNKKLLLETDGLPLRQSLAHEIYYSQGRGPDFADRVSGKFGGKTEKTEAKEKT